MGRGPGLQARALIGFHRHSYDTGPFMGPVAFGAEFGVRKGKDDSRLSAMRGEFSKGRVPL